MFPMLVRDVLLTLAAHEFFSPKWSPRIRDEWTRNLIARMRERDDDVIARTRVERIAAAVEAAFRELRARKKNPPMDSAELIRRLRDGGLVQTSLWLNTSDVVELI